jgi:hypothetical protein
MRVRAAVGDDDKIKRERGEKKVAEMDTQLAYFQRSFDQIRDKRKT